MIYQHLIRPLIFRLTQHDAECAHTLSLALLDMLGRLPPLLRLLQRHTTLHHPALPRTLFGVTFPNPVGLAAGYDKNGVALPALAALGFGFIEVGTVTWHAQPGNPRPRVFRFAHDSALVNRMGFNNAGAPALAARLQRMPACPVPIGISLGKSRRALIEQAIGDYCASLRLLAPAADYVAINVSSPNTPGLRSLQQRDDLDELLAALQHIARHHQQHSGRAAPVPLLVKIAPDLSEHAISQVLEVCSRQQVSGIIATNTYPVGSTAPHLPSGGLSGRPLAEISLRVVRFIARETNGHLPIIGVGGIGSVDDAARMLDAGASLLQLYTGVIYQGPGLVRAINHAITQQ